MILNLFVITIIFTILSFKKERGLAYVFNIIFNVDWRKRRKINRVMLVKK